MDRDTLMQELVSFRSASDVLAPFIAGAQALSLIRGALKRGILDATRTPQTLDQIAGKAALNPEHARLICEALFAYSILSYEDGTYQLRDPWLVLSAPNAYMLLDDTVAGAQAKAHAIELALSSHGEYWRLPVDDRVALAKEATVNPAATLSPALVRHLFVREAPEVNAVLRAGGRYLDLGCGVAGRLLCLVQAYPEITAVGLDNSDSVIAEAQQRAWMLDVNDRVDLRTYGDLRFDVHGEFDVVFWNQCFLPWTSREMALLAARNALKPGGFLLAPLREKPPQSLESLRTPAGQRYSADRVVASNWDIPTVDAQELQEEVMIAGFEFIRHFSSEWDHYALAKRPTHSRMPTGAEWPHNEDSAD